MSKKFKRNELERLRGITESDIDLVMKYQKTLPVLCDNESVEKFSIDARLLHKQLGVKKKFATWIKTNTNGYVENTDFITSSPQGTDGKVSKFTNEKDYILTLDLAKEIAMFTGRSSQANDELKENSRMTRQYFILMEKVVLENKIWLETRDPEKIEYKRMSDAVNAWCYRIWHHKASRSEYAVEADGINKIVTGKTSQKLKLEYGCPTNDLIRDYLKQDHNEELLFLERQNQVLLAMDMGFTERMNMLEKMHEVTFRKDMEKVA